MDEDTERRLLRIEEMAYQCLSVLLAACVFIFAAVIYLIGSISYGSPWNWIAALLVFFGGLFAAQKHMKKFD